MKTGIPSLNIPKTDPMDIDKYLSPPHCSIPSVQGGRSCTKAQRAFAEKFHDIMICRDLLTFWKTLGPKLLFWVKISVSWEKSALLHGTCSILY